MGSLSSSHVLKVDPLSRRGLGDQCKCGHKSRRVSRNQNVVSFFGFGRITVDRNATLNSGAKINRSRQANISTYTSKYGDESMLCFSDDTEAAIINSGINGNCRFINGTLLTMC